MTSEISVERQFHFHCSWRNHDNGRKDGDPYRLWYNPRRSQGKEAPTTLGHSYLLW
jgi:hypothetical protein